MVLLGNTARASPWRSSTRPRPRRAASASARWNCRGQHHRRQDRLDVAHRLTQAATADSVVLLEDGRVMERGSPGGVGAMGGRDAARRVA
ncbi:hypothetical protein AB0L65_10020 [Nonomuraea sp. NPDC052116]|uniref:hypothetical protein n=1 Tax=Nonomuraea sp. NPDC052116 TaxID=3155665 RepID=UPI00342ACABD